MTDETQVAVAVALPQDAATTMTTLAEPATTVRFEAEKKLLQEFTKTALSLVDETVLRFDQDGLHANLVDPAHVAMIQAHVPPSAFKSWQVPPLGGQVLLDVDRLAKFVGLAKQSIHVELTGPTTMVAGFGNLTRTFKLGDPASVPSPKVPDLNLPARVSVPVEDLLDVLGASGAVSDHVCLTVNGNGFRVTAEGDTDTVTMPLGHVAQQGEAKSLFSLDYLVKIVKAAPRKGSVTLDLGVDYPVRITWLASGVTYSALLAPRIEAD